MVSSNKSNYNLLYLLFVFLIVRISVYFTQIIKDINEKNIENYSNIEGIVEKGDGVSKMADWPTANIKNNKNIPFGVYSGKSNYGNVTFYSRDNWIEAHIHDFNGNIYGKTLKISNIKKLPGFNNEFVEKIYNTLQ
tara:strand:- start:41 stop:448 length:408 start_codon:yes stop_codon:yes gene_type:complete